MAMRPWTPPNSVFAPEKSVTCRTVTGSCGVWSSLILQNGTIDQMEARLAENDLGGTVTYYDQGYSDIVESLDGYTRVSRTVLLVGLALWAVVLAAYCVLLPMQEGKTALRMWTLGAKRRDIAGQIWTPSALMAGSQRLQGGGVAAAGHHHVRLAPGVVGGPIPDADALGAVLHRLLHGQPLGPGCLLATITLT